MNIEQVCKDAIAVVERFLNSGALEEAVYYDMQDELHEAQKAVDNAWYVAKSRKSRRMCRAAWNACLFAKTNHLSKEYVDNFWELVK